MLQNVGNYRLLRSLGRGATAQVYLGEHIHLQTHAAIKLFDPALDRQEFLKEARIIASLRHQHIVRVMEFDFTAQGSPFLVMEYAAHGSLLQHHTRGTRLAPQVIVAYLEQIGAALTYIHQANIIHADIKPENMLLDKHDTLLLGDFGIATSARSTQQWLRGTPAYIAPEQIQLHPCTASDQYALAIVVYEWLCGQRPFQGPGREDFVAQHMQATVPPLRQFAPDLATELEQVVLRALAKDPAARFPDVAAFVSAFVQGARAATAGAAPFTPAATPGSIHTPIQPTQPVVVQPVTPVSGTATTILPGNIPQLAAGPVKPLSRRQGETLYTVHLEAGSIRALAWSPDGKTLAAGCDYQLVFTWEALTGTNQRSYHLHEHQLRALAWSPNGHMLASACADQLIHVWDPDQADPQPLLTYRGHAGNFTLGLACIVAWSPAGLLLASAGTDQTAQVWRFNKGELLCTCRGHTDDINALAWSPDGTQLATSSDDSSVRLWDAHSGQLRATFQHHRKRVYTLAWSPDGTRLASAGEGSDIYTWKVSGTVQPNYLIYRGHTRSIYTLAWSPDSTHLASAGRDSTAQIWQANDGSHHYTYTDHKGSILALAWSPDGAHLATADEHEQVRVWQAWR